MSADNIEKTIPKISVVIPLYNKAPYIARAIDSVLNQTEQDFEIVVVNDASTDGGEETVKKYTDPRMHLFHRQEPGPGGHAARNMGIAKASAELVAFLDADDSYNSDFLKTILSLREKFPAAGAYATAHELREKDNSLVSFKYSAIPIAPWEGIIHDYFLTALGAPPVWTSATAVPKYVFTQSGTFPEGVCMGGDLDMWLRIAIKYPIAFSHYIGATLYRSASGRISDARLPICEPRLITTAQEAIARKEVPIYLIHSLNEYINKSLLESAKYCILSGQNNKAKEFLKRCKTTYFRKRKLWWCFWAILPSFSVSGCAYFKINIINKYAGIITSLFKTKDGKIKYSGPVKFKIKVLHIAGYQSDKLGSLERFWVALARSSPGTHYFLFPNSNLHPDISSGLCKYGRILQPGGKFQIFDIVKAIAVVKPDILHVHFTPSAYLAAMMGALVPGIRIIWTKHSLSKVKTARNTFSHGVMKRICGSIIAISNAVKNEMVSKYGFDTSKIVVVHTGVDLDVFQYNFNKASGRRIMALAVSQMVPEKGIDSLLKAVRILKEDNSDIFFKIAGKGPLLEEYKRFALELGVSDICEFIGQTDMVSDLMNEADIVVMPSRFEGMPFVLLEAMACGKPVVATSVGGIPEAVSSGVNGLLVKRDNPRELADAIKRFLAEPALAEKMGVSARETVERSFRLDQMVDGWNGVYVNNN